MRFLRWLADGDNLLKLWTCVAALLTIALEVVMATVWKGGVDFTFGTLLVYVVIALEAAQARRAGRASLSHTLGV
jgi:hypothetical protein